MFKILLILMLLGAVLLLGFKKLAVIAVKKLPTPAPEPTLDPNIIPKFVNQLVIPPVYDPMVVRDVHGNVKSHNYIVEMTQFRQQVLPPKFPETTVWGYAGMVKDPETGECVFFQHSPGATFEAVRGIPINVQWVNRLTGFHLFPVDPTLH